MTVSAQSVIKTVHVDILQDSTCSKWPISELCRYFNQGQREIVMFRPDACTKRVTLALTAGYKQTLPTGGSLLIDVICNTGGNKRAVKMPKDGRAIIDSQVANWRSAAQQTEILEAYYDERDPLHFEVFPPANSSSSLEIVHAAIPTDITEASDPGTYSDVTGNMDLQDKFQGALIQMIIFHAFYKDAKYAAQSARANAALTAAANLLQVDIKTMQAYMARSDDMQGAPVSST
jgi:hypothetical protein